MNTQGMSCTIQFLWKGKKVILRPDLIVLLWESINVSTSHPILLLIIISCGLYFAADYKRKLWTKNSNTWRTAVGSGPLSEKF